MKSGQEALGRTTLLSETDQHGIILFANEDFCKTSQYRKDELIGKPHNIIRHPDMPKKLFSMLWTTIKRGETFRAVIKNQAKDGTHYWVQAVIMPILDRNMKVEKYVGVRHLIDDDDKAEELYKQQLTAFR